MLLRQHAEEPLHLLESLAIVPHIMNVGGHRLADGPILQRHAQIDDPQAIEHASAPSPAADDASRPTWSVLGGTGLAKRGDRRSASYSLPRNRRSCSEQARQRSWSPSVWKSRIMRRNWHEQTQALGGNSRNSS